MSKLDELQAELNRMSDENHALKERLAYYLKLPDFTAQRNQHRFNDEGICIRCGEDAEEWEAGCVEEIWAAKDARIAELSASADYELVATRQAAEIDGLKNQVNELREQVAEAQTGAWVPVGRPFFLYGRNHVRSVRVRDAQITVGAPELDEPIELELPDDVRLCRYRPQPVVQAESAKDEWWETSSLAAFYRRPASAQEE